METLGEFIASRRTEFGLTQAELAALLHTSVRTVSAWEHGRAKPASESHDLLELVLHWETPISDVLEGWAPWDSSGGRKTYLQTYLEAPPGREEIWGRARRKADRAIESLDSPRSRKKAQAKTT